MTLAFLCRFNATNWHDKLTKTEFDVERPLLNQTVASITLIRGITSAQQLTDRRLYATLVWRVRFKPVPRTHKSS